MRFFTRIGGVGSFTGDFVARYNKTYTLSLFTHPQLRHLRVSSVFRFVSVVSISLMADLIDIWGTESIITDAAKEYGL